jgi:ubiquinone/menaquinone biosynthesis C-methylase UbiE
MSKTKHEIQHTTSGHLVQGLRAKYYDIGNAPLGLPLVTLPHVRLISLQPGQSLLDIGCGTGEVIYRAYRKFGEAVSLYGVDPSEDMLEVAQYKLRKAKNVILETGTGEQLRFQDASFDWIVSSLTFHHIPLDVKRATLRESYRLLKPGGKILISDFGKPTHVIGRLLSNIWVNHAYTSEFEDTVTGGGIHHTLATKPG